MNKQRRSVAQITALIGLMVTTGLISQSQAQDWNKAAFDGKSLDDVMKALGASGFEKSNAITLNAPDIAENGAVVPVGVVTSLKATQMAILVEKNLVHWPRSFSFRKGLNLLLQRGSRWHKVPMCMVLLKQTVNGT